MHKQYIGTVKDGARGLLHHVWAHVAQNAAEVNPYMEALVTCYHDVFSGPPYNEDYTDPAKQQEYIRGPFPQFADRGAVVFLVTGETIEGNLLIGFGGADRTDLNDSVGPFLADHAHRFDAPLSQYLYMAELGVLTAYRRQGLGDKLVRLRVEEALKRPERGYTHLIMRTASVNSNSAGVYLRMGAKPVEGLIQPMEDSDSKERIFLTMPLR